MRSWERWRHFDLAFAGLVACVTVLTRLPYRTRMLYNWDAVQFALALGEYDVAKHQPHPPGYFLYVAMGKALNLLLHDPNQSYVMLGIGFSALATIVVYFLAKEMYGRVSAATAVLLLITSPLFWFYGEVGLSYAGEALFASIVALLTYQMLLGPERFLYLSAGYLGLAGGVRQSILLLLFPLWLGAAWWRTRSIWKICVALFCLALAALTWFLSMIWLTGGLIRYLAASDELFVYVARSTSIFAGATLDTALAQLRAVLESTALGLGTLSVLPLFLPVLWRQGQLQWGRQEVFLAGWVVPPMLFYILVHFGQPGYVLTFLPGLYIFLGHALVRLGEALLMRLRVQRVRRAFLTGLVLVFSVANGVLFVHARQAPQPGERRETSRLDQWLRGVGQDYRQAIWSWSAAGLRENDEVIRTYLAAIRALYRPEETVLITEVGNPRSYTWLRHAMFYLPEYPIYQLRVSPDLPLGYYAPQSAVTILITESDVIHLPPRIRRLVWFVDYWNPDEPRPRGLQEIALPYGRFLYALRLGRKPLEYAGFTFLRLREARVSGRPSGR